ncbi:DUF1572 family protein [Paenibacillus larvae]
MSDYAEVNLSGYLLQEWTHALQKTKRLGDQSMIQLEKDEDFQWSAHEETNSIATIVSHMAGNMESRWKDLLTSDGEKESRDRDAEFLPKAWSKGQVLEQWERGWAITYKALQVLQGKDLLKIIRIRNEPHTVVQAINRQLSHYSYHVGQIVYIAKLLKGQDWKSLSIPRNKDRT